MFKSSIRIFFKIYKNIILFIPKINDFFIELKYFYKSIIKKTQNFFLLFQ
jgi:hypothetical protein